MATQEEFSFPTIADAYPCSIDSPPLWRLSPPPSPDSFHRHVATREEENNQNPKDEEDCFAMQGIRYKQRKSLSDVEKGSRMVQTDDKEEKMDMLWEDLNEELSTSRSSSSSSSRDITDLGCVQALKVPKNTSGAMVSPRKPNTLVLIKVLKKLFLLQSFHRSAKNRAWRP